MRKIYLLLTFILCFNVLPAQSYDWVTPLRKGNHTLMTTTSGGTTYVYGFITDSVEFGSQTFYMSEGQNYIAAYNSSGDLLDAIQLDSIQVRDMTASLTSLYIAGNFASGGNVGATVLSGSDNRDAFYAQLDQDLNVTLVRTGTNDGTLDFFSSIDVDNAGNVYIGTGFTGDSLLVDGIYFTGRQSDSKGLLLKFDPAGNLVSSKSYQMTGNGGLSFTNIAVDEVTGDIFVSGDASDDADKDSVSFDGIWYKSVGFDNDFVARFSSAMTGEAVRNVTTIFQEGITDLELDGSGNPYISINQFVNGYVLEKLTSTLDTLWSTESSGSFYMGADDFIVSGGKIFVGGSFEGVGDFHGADSDTVTNESAFLVQLDTAGNFIDLRVLENNGFSEITGVGTDLPGNLYLSGHITDDTNFDTISVAAGNTITGFVARIPFGIFVGEKLNQVSEFAVYPNPAANMLMIEGVGINKMVRIFDHTGKLVNSFVTGSSLESADVTRLSQGIYLLQIEGEAKAVRFLKE